MFVLHQHLNKPHLAYSYSSMLLLLICRFVDAFHNHIRTAVENAITRRITEGVSKLDELLQKIPRKINVDKFVALNVTLVNGPLYGNSSVEFDVNGLFILLDKVPELNYLLNHPHFSLGCGGASKMLLISFDEVVFNSASAVLFQVICTLQLFLLFEPHSFKGKLYG